MQNLAKRTAFILTLILALFRGQAQELNATVQVLAPTLPPNQELFGSLQKAVENLVNFTVWTSENYEVEERIKCSFVLTLSSASGNSFSGSLQVNYSRPIYNSNYDSPVLNYIDNDISFSYIENQPVEYIENQHESNLSSIFAFYSFIIVGLDKDTYMLEGGEQYYTKAQNIVNMAQSDGSASGWKSFDGSKNRFWMVDNLMTNGFSDIRNCYYEYHMNGLDLMWDESKHAEAKKNMSDALISLKRVYEKRPNAFILQLFFDAKSDEIVNVFKGGPKMDLNNLVTVLKLIDAGRSSKYEGILR